MFQTTSSHTFFSKFSRRYVIGTILLVALGTVAVHWYLRPSPVNNTSLKNNATQVSVATVASLSTTSNSLPIVGTVTSLNKATVLSQTSGEIVSRSRTLGDTVSAGEVIAEFANSSQQAAVLQAKGTYEVALAGLATVQETSVKGSTISVGQANQDVKNAQNALQNSLQNMYAVQDDAIHAKADQMFSNPRTRFVQITLSVPNYQLVSLIRQERIDLQRVFKNILSYTKETPSSTFDTRSASMITAARSVIQFLNHLTTAVSETPASQSASSVVLSGYAASLSGARSEVTAGLSGLIATKGAYDNALSRVQTATNSADSGITNNTALAQARVKQALGIYNAARANLGKTIIRSPIDGTIVSLPITRGDYVPMFSPVAVISNPHTLYVKTFVTSNTARAVVAGDHVLVNGSHDGIVTFVAPSLNPLTHKREIKIGLIGNRRTLTDGETVLVTFIRTPVSSTDTVNTTLSVPLSAIKVTPAGSQVFTVSTSSTLVAHKVTVKTIDGSSVLLQAGVSPTTKIVLDARGLSNGQKVIVTTK